MIAPAVRRRLTPIIALLAGLASVLGLVAAAPIAVAQPNARSAPSSAADAVRTAGGSHGAKPTVVLVHGAWADSSSWNGVIERLQRAGYPVRAVYNPLRGLANDSAVLAGFLSTIPGPVVLAGHSYGGAVISNGAAASPNVKALDRIGEPLRPDGPPALAASPTGTDRAGPRQRGLGLGNLHWPVASRHHRQCGGMGDRDLDAAAEQLFQQPELLAPAVNLAGFGRVVLQVAALAGDSGNSQGYPSG